MHIGTREGSSVAQDEEHEYFLVTDDNASQSSSWFSDDRNNDDADTNMEIDDDDDADKDDDFEGNDHLTGFRVFVHDKPKELPKSTPTSPTITCLSLEVYTMLLNDPPKNELMDNHKVTSFISSAFEVPFGINVDIQTTDFIMKENYREADDQHMSPPPATTTHNHTTEQKLVRSFQRLGAKSSTSNMQLPEPTLKKRLHDDQDLPNDHEGEKDKKRSQKRVGELFLKSSKKDKAPMDSSNDIPRTIDAAKERKPNRKLKKLIKKDELTIDDLEGAGLEMLKSRYKNYVKLEYHVNQIKSEMFNEAKLSDEDDDLTKPRS
nr:hypothetical protein [Tanacetum cinerariifolium]